MLSFMFVSPWIESVPDFFFWTVWSSVSVSRRSVREHAGSLGGRTAWRGRGGGYDPCRRQTVQKKTVDGGAPVRRSVSRPRRAWAWRGMFRCRACPEASAEGPLFPAMRPADIGGRTRGIVETVSLRSTHPIISQFGINPFFTDVHVQKFPEGPSFSHVLESPMGFVFRDGFCRARSRLFSETGSGEEPWRSLASNWRPAVGSSD